MQSCFTVKGEGPARLTAWVIRGVFHSDRYSNLDSGSPSPYDRFIANTMIIAESRNLSYFRTLGRSGLVVSPLTLGTMTFGTARWGSSDEVSKAVFNAYVGAGGNSIDTADVYSGGRSETLVGSFIAERNLRDKLVLATKFGFNAEAGNPNAGGNGRKNIHRAIEGSLRRLGTGYIDL